MPHQQLHSLYQRELGTLEAVATLADYNTTGGRINTLGLTTGGKFYTSAPTVTIAHPGTVAAAATIGIAGSSINPSSVAFTFTGRAYTSLQQLL